MITVPRLPSVQPEGIPSARVSDSAPLTAFGGGAGNAPARIAQGSSDLSGQIAQIAQEEKRKADIIATTQAGSQLSDLETQLRVHARSQEGANAFGLPEEISQQWKDGSSAIAETMTNPQQKLAFQEQAASHWGSLNEAVQMHVADQRKVYAGQVYDGYLASEANAAVASYTDPARVALSIERRKAAITDHADQFGIAPQERDKAIAQMTSDTHVTVLNEMLASTQDAEQPTLAKAYYDAHQGEIIGPKAAITQALVAKKSLEGAAQQQGDAIYKSSTSLDDALNQVQQASQDNPSSMTPQVRERVEQRIRQRFEDHQRSQLETQKQTVIQLNDMLHQNGGHFDALPINLRDLLSPNEEESMRRNADAIRFPKDRSAPGSVKQLNNMIGLNAASRAIFADPTKTNFDDYHLSEKDLAHFNTVRASIQRGEDVTARSAGRADKVAAQHAQSLWHLDSAAATSGNKGVTPPQFNHPFVYTSPKAPGLPLPSMQTSPGGGGASLNTKPVPHHLIDRLPILQSYKDASIDNPAYADYLLHHVEPEE